jgi:hypothetical protein
VRRVGDRLRITAQLIEAESGNHLWADRYDGDAVDVLALQDDIVRAIATTLGDRIDAAGRERALRLSAEALSAYDHVLRCEAHFMSFTKDGNAEARRLAQKATELDPQSADAHVQLGWTHCMDHLFGWVEDRAQTLDAALVLARRGILLDAADGRSRSLLGFIHIYRREYDEAYASFARPSLSIPTTSRPTASMASTWRRSARPRPRSSSSPSPGATTPSRSTGSSSAAASRCSRRGVTTRLSRP